MTRGRTGGPGRPFFVVVNLTGAGGAVQRAEALAGNHAPGLRVLLFEMERAG